MDLLLDYVSVPKRTFHCSKEREDTTVFSLVKSWFNVQEWMNEGVTCGNCSRDGNFLFRMFNPFRILCDCELIYGKITKYVSGKWCT
jgi:hypothetical protein